MNEPAALPTDSARACRPCKRIFDMIGSAIWIMAISLMPAANAPAITREATPLQWRAAPSTATAAESKTFPSGDATLSGTLYLPHDGQALGAVVVTHSASKPLRDAPLYRHLKEMLPPLGIAVLM